MNKQLYISKELNNHINQHAIKDYPFECCGILIGDFSTRVISKIMPTKNIREGRLNDRFEIAGEELIKGETLAESLNLDVIGYYHSHPDHPNRPSEYDRKRAFPGMSYIIVSVDKNKQTNSKSWLLNDDTKQFDEETIIITDK